MVRATRVAVVLLAVLVLGGCQYFGNPTNIFGNDPTRVGPQPGVWGAINGPFSSHSDGDPFSTECAGENGGTGTTCGTTDSRGSTVINPNPQYNPNGYVWAVDVPAADAGSTVTVSIYDPSFGPNPGLGETYSGTTQVGFSTSYQLFASSGTADQASTDQSLGMNSSADGPAGGTQGLDLCTGGTPGYKVFAPGTSYTTYQNAWYPLCTFTVPAGFAGGVYPLQVKSSAIPGVSDAGTGYNVFSVEATTTAATSPMVYAIKDLSIWTGNTSSFPTTSQFYLANLSQGHWAGHSLVVDAYDPGDGGSGNDYVQVLGPPSGVPAVVPTGGTALPCRYSTPTVAEGGPTTYTDSANCSIQTRNGTFNPPSPYNERWLRIVVPIPASYTCSTDCWFTLKFSFGSGNTDRSVWVLGVLA
jgi:hypothetical protein